MAAIDRRVLTAQSTLSRFLVYREWCGNLTMRRHQKRSLYGSMRSCIHTVYITYDTMFSRRVENYSGCSKRIPRRGNSVITAIFVHRRRAVRMRRSMFNGLMFQLARKCAVTYLPVLLSESIADEELSMLSAPAHRCHGGQFLCARVNEAVSIQYTYSPTNYNPAFFPKFPRYSPRTDEPCIIDHLGP